MIGRPYPGDTYDPGYFVRRYPAKAWRKRHPRNYVINRSTYVPEPNPYTDRRWARMEAARRRSGVVCLRVDHTAEEIGRNSFDIDWRWLGTRGY